MMGNANGCSNRELGPVGATPEDGADVTDALGDDCGPACGGLAVFEQYFASNKTSFKPSSTRAADETEHHWRECVCVCVRGN